VGSQHLRLASRAFDPDRDFGASRLVGCIPHQGGP
jgi:hypothetical protein